jgi:hypothetical protein
LWTDAAGAPTAAAGPATAVASRRGWARPGRLPQRGAPDLIVACIVGDGEAETGPLAASWHSNKFLNPAVDGAVLPILPLNGWKIANPTVLARIGREELEALMRGYGHEPYFVSGDEPMAMHRQFAQTLDTVLARIREIQAAASTLSRCSGTCTSSRAVSGSPATKCRPGPARRG